MKNWQQIILDTAQLGGTLIFIEDQVVDLSLWTRVLSEACQHKLAYSVRSASDLESQTFVVRAEDLLCLFDEQSSVASLLLPKILGQRLLIAKTEGRASGLYDVEWRDSSLENWQSGLKEISEQLRRLKPLPKLAGSYRRPCLFLDRDDVVVTNVPYNKEASKVELMPGIVDLINQAHDKNFWVALVTNQSGLGRGWISWAEYQQVHQQMLRVLAAQGAWLDECVWASYIGEGGVTEGRLYPGLRKPRSGMFHLVNEKLRVDLKNSVMVGDSGSDLIAAYGVEIKKLFLFESHKMDSEVEALNDYQKKNPEFQFQLLSELKELLI